MSDDEEEVQLLAQPQPEVEARRPEAAAGSAGELVEHVEGELNTVKECDRVSEEITEGTATLITKYLNEARSSTEMEKLAKKYPRVSNVANMKVPRVEEELFQALEQKVKNTDQAYQAIQKGVLGALAALAPVFDLTLARAKTGGDQELVDMGRNVLDSLHLLAYAHNSLSTRRKETLKPVLSPIYAKVMGKGQDLTQEWLYGGDLVETTKQCEAAKKVSDKVLKRKQFVRPQQQQKRFRTPFIQQQVLRPFMPYQGQGHIRFPAPQAFAQFPMQQQQFQGQFQQQPQQGFGFGFGFPRRFRHPRGPRQQGFAKRGTYQK